MTAALPDLQTPAEALVAIISEHVDGFTGVLWERRAFDSPRPAAVGVPTFRRRQPDEAESQLGSTDWALEYPISFYLSFENATADQGRMVTALQQFGAAIDADPSLDGTVFDSAITEGVPFVEQDNDRPQGGYQVTVAALKLVSQS